jgi:hypothetical protein
MVTLATTTRIDALAALKSVSDSYTKHGYNARDEERLVVLLLSESFSADQATNRTKLFTKYLFLRHMDLDLAVATTKAVYTVLGRKDELEVI